MASHDAFASDYVDHPGQQTVVFVALDGPGKPGHDRVGWCISERSSGKYWRLVMPEVTIENFSEKPLKVGIEPWADEEVLAPRERFTITYAEPGEISFSVFGDGDVGIGVMSTEVKVIGRKEARTYVHK
jgi:hypothetical protein